MPHLSAASNPALFLCQLFADYLGTEESITAGIPAAAVLPVQIMDNGLNPLFPSLVIAAKEDKSLGYRPTVEVSFMLLTSIRSEAVGAVENAKETTRQQASEWLNIIQQRLQDRAALSTFLGGLDESLSEGWTFRKNITWQGEQPPMRNKEMGTVYYALTCTCHLWWERPL